MRTEDLELPGYRMIRTLGEGGFGQVFRALHEGTGAEVAVKVVLDDTNPEALGRFRDEARILQALAGQNVPKALDLGLPPEAPVPYLAMELIEGVPMSDLLRVQEEPEGRLEVLRQVLPGVCRGLQALHQQGAVHRDLKPENMMWRRADREGVLIDLGLVKAEYLPPKTATGFVLGTPAFMAPEQLTGQTKTYGPATDVYQLGLVVLMGLEGSFEDPDLHEIEAAVRRCRDGVERLEARLAAVGASPQLAAWVRSATAQSPGQRGVGVAELSAALAAASVPPTAPVAPAGRRDGAAAASAGRPAVTSATAPPVPRNWAPLAGAVGFVLGGLVSGFLGGGGDPAPTPVATPAAPTSAAPAGPGLLEDLLVLEDFGLQATPSRRLLVPADWACDGCEVLDADTGLPSGAWVARTPPLRTALTLELRSGVAGELPGPVRERLDTLAEQLRRVGVPGLLEAAGPPAASAPFDFPAYVARVQAPFMADHMTSRLPATLTLDPWADEVRQAYLALLDLKQGEPRWRSLEEAVRAGRRLPDRGLLPLAREVTDRFLRMLVAAWMSAGEEGADSVVVAVDTVAVALVWDRWLAALPGVEVLVDFLSSQPVRRPAQLLHLAELGRHWTQVHPRRSVGEAGDRLAREALPLVMANLDRDDPWVGYHSQAMARLAQLHGEQERSGEVLRILEVYRDELPRAIHATREIVLQRAREALESVPDVEAARWRPLVEALRAGGPGGG